MPFLSCQLELLLSSLLGNCPWIMYYFSYTIHISDIWIFTISCIEQFSYKFQQTFMEKCHPWNIHEINFIGGRASVWNFDHFMEIPIATFHGQKTSNEQLLLLWKHLPLLPTNSLQLVVIGPMIYGFNKTMPLLWHFSVGYSSTLFLTLTTVAPVSQAVR